MIRDMWRWMVVEGSWWERVLFFVLAGSTLACVGMLVALPWVIRAEKRERAALIAEGCEVVDTHTTTTLIPMRVGNATYLQPHQRTVESWRCPDGREFNR